MEKYYTIRTEDIDQHLTPWYRKTLNSLIRRIERRGGKVSTDEEDILYKCDGFACNGNCSTECHYTSDITHAENFERGPNGEYYIEK